MSAVDRLPSFDFWGRPTYADLCREDIARWYGEMECESWQYAPEPAPQPTEPSPAPTDPLLLGAQAERLLSDPVLCLALAAIDRKLTRTILGSAVGETGQREAAYQLHWAKEELIAQLRGILDNATMLKAERDAQERERGAA